MAKPLRTFIVSYSEFMGNGVNVFFWRAKRKPSQAQVLKHVRENIHCDGDEGIWTRTSEDDKVCIEEYKDSPMMPTLQDYAKVFNMVNDKVGLETTFDTVQVDIG